MEKIASVIKYEGNNSLFVWKHPETNFNNLTQLIVYESQEAILFKNGQALDTFGPGRHTLETQNIPSLSKLIRDTTRGSNPFVCDVYYINKTVQMGIKWGTPELIKFIEPTLGIPLGIGASGELNLMVSDSRKLIVKMVGTMRGIAWNDGGPGFTKSIYQSFRALILTAIKSNLANCIKVKNINILDIDDKLEELSEILKEKINIGLEEYGLIVPQMYITTINLPEDDVNIKKLRELQTLSLHTKMAEAEASIIAAKRKAIIEEQLTETEITRHTAERELIDAQVKAQSLKLEGLAEAEIMKAKGYTQKDVIYADVQKAYAEGIGNISGSNASSGLVGDFVGLGVGLATASHVGHQMNDMIKGMSDNGVPKENKKTCLKCGSILNENAKFCLECGTKVMAIPSDTVTCSKCGSITLKGKFCQECGASLSNVCSNCGSEIVVGAKFCPDCGNKL